jgi:ATP-dependent RNA helicase SUPV3L1/SUV3
VFFSKSEILAAKYLIESKTSYKCAVVFGSLPPETRVAQAALFNDPSKPQDILLATDAIGMGLNLSVRRIIFMSMRKFDGHSRIKLPIMDVKQIAGRAGRYKVADISGQQTKRESTAEDVIEQTIEDPSEAPRAKYGLVTTLSPESQRYLKYCMVTPSPVLKHAQLQLPDEILRRYANLVGLGSGFGRIWDGIPRHAVLDPSAPYSMADLREPNRVAALLDTIEGLLFEDRLQLVKVPVRRYRQCEEAFSAYCRVIANGESLPIYDIPESSVEFLQMTPMKPAQHLTEKYEIVSNNISLFLWLQYRFPNNFLDRQSASELAGLCERRFNEYLEKLNVKLPTGTDLLRRISGSAARASKPFRKRRWG